MPRLTFDAEELYDFHLLGISSPESDYRFCWALNQKLGWNLERAEDIILPGEAGLHFATYVWDTENRISLVANKYLNTLLLPELKTIEYLLVFYGEPSEEWLKDTEKKLESTGVVFYVEWIEPALLKSPNREFLLL